MEQKSRKSIVELLDWCTANLGATTTIVSDNSKEHGGHESSTYRLRAAERFYYLKIHQTRLHWEQEVHAYERWAPALGGLAPQLIALHEERPLALLLSERPGQVLENVHLTNAQERSVWRTAGELLIALHELEVGDCFGPCGRDGTCRERWPQNGAGYMVQKLEQQIEQALQGQYIDAHELKTLQAVLAMTPAFAKERPRPCHRDYCAANWLVNKEGILSGIIDFEFAYWDVRAADFARDPNWTWMHHPDLLIAFFEGYGRSLTTAEETQLFVARADYALGAILWGHDHQFYGFEQEGHDALAYLAQLLR
ncbi:MAG: aminoglycoside phosphotransferase family protein [Anaerolineales bacterium]|nr:aminoglycoside phosphotransferase family protein [Anaerolineales bacterium]